MNRTTLLAFAAAASLATGLACSDIVAPSRSAPYDWRLIVNSHSAGLGNKAVFINEAEYAALLGQSAGFLVVLDDFSKVKHGC